MQLLKIEASSLLLSELGELSSFWPFNEDSIFLSGPFHQWMKFTLLFQEHSISEKNTLCRISEENTFCISFWGDLSTDSETAGKSLLGTAQIKFCCSDKKRGSQCPVLLLLPQYAKPVCWWHRLAHSLANFIYGSTSLWIWNEVWTVWMNIKRMLRQLVKLHMIWGTLPEIFATCL